MYSRVQFPRGVRRVILRRERLNGISIYSAGRLACASHRRLTWYVFCVETFELEAVFYAKPNVHGWLASEAHAKSYVLRNGDPAFNPFELDSVP